jgi:hypothetical protein
MNISTKIYNPSNIQSISLHIYLPTYIYYIYLPISIHIYLPTYIYLYIPTYIFIYLPTYLSIYLSIYLCVYLYVIESIIYMPINQSYLPTYQPIIQSTIYLPINHSTNLAMHLSAYQSFYLSINLSVYNLSAYHSMYPPFNLSICLSNNLPINLSAINQSICQPIYISAYQSIYLKPTKTSPLLHDTARTSLYLSTKEGKSKRLQNSVLFLNASRRSKHRTQQSKINEPGYCDQYLQSDSHLASHKDSP